MAIDWPNSAKRASPSGAGGVQYKKTPALTSGALMVLVLSSECIAALEFWLDTSKNFSFSLAVLVFLNSWRLWSLQGLVGVSFGFWILVLVLGHWLVSVHWILNYTKQLVFDYS